MFGLGIGEIVGGAVGVGGAVVGFWKAKQLKGLVVAVFDFYKAYRDARDEDSPGGIKITAEEFDELVENLQKAALSTAPLLSRWMDRK